MAPHNAYQCAGDDQWLAIAVMNDAEWEALVRAMDEPAWARNAKFATNAGRLASQHELDAALETWASLRDARGTMELLQSAGVRAGMVQKASDRFERDPQLKARGWWSQLPHEELGDCDYDGVVPRLGLTPGQLRTSGPMLGADTAAVAMDLLGFTPEEYADHEAAGVFM